MEKRFRSLALWAGVTTLVFSGLLLARGGQADRSEFGQRRHFRAEAAGEPGSFGHFRPGHRLGRLARYLELTEEQKEQLRHLLEAEKSLNQPYLEQLREVRRQLQETTAGGSFPEEVVRALAEQQGQLLAELTVSRYRVGSRLFSLLTPEQQSKLQELKDKFQSRRSHRSQKSGS